MALISLLRCGDSPLIVSAITCDDDEEDRFYFTIFRFPGQTGADEVYLKAKVIVCLKSNMASSCRADCTACTTTPRARRKRRDTIEELQQTEFYVTAGPFKIREPDRQGL